VDALELERYKQMLLAKHKEVLTGRAGKDAPIPAAGVRHGDVLDQAVADSEAQVQVRLRQTEAHLLRAIEEALKRIARGTFGAKITGRLLFRIQRQTEAGINPTLADLVQAPYSRLDRQGVCDFRQACGVELRVGLGLGQAEGDDCTYV
jgi:hypothetical protein